MKKRIEIIFITFFVTQNDNFLYHISISVKLSSPYSKRVKRQQINYDSFSFSLT